MNCSTPVAAVAPVLDDVEEDGEPEETQSGNDCDDGSGGSTVEEVFIIYI